MILYGKDRYRTEMMVICECSSESHRISFATFINDDPEIYVTIHLQPLRFWRRIWTAIRYACGYRSRYGDFEEIVLYPETAREIGAALVRAADGEEL